ncbi:HD domain-containing protein [Vibrio tubiashii]|uniref:HD-GYP domain-containing protein n=1 Tax=Vibrio tubiashii TaxID=29498 RepID=UPI00234EBC4D|nr:HD domain-containing phosphohydrolase [Vibrio tubiashii]WCP68748.1 HD domain-containing protein [Vibrio tubiashii]
MVNFSLISQIASENTTITSKLDSIYVHASEAYSSLSRFSIALIGESKVSNYYVKDRFSDSGSYDFTEHRLTEGSSLTSVALKATVRVIDQLSSMLQTERIQELIRLGHRSSYTFPISFKGKTIGFIFINASEDAFFSRQDIARDFTFLSQVTSSLFVQLFESQRHFQSSLKLALKIGHARDPETKEHLIRMGMYSELLARILSKTMEEITHQFIHRIRLYAPFHDIGKYMIPDEILYSDKIYTAEERAIMNNHTLFGEEIIDDVVAHCEQETISNAEIRFIKNIVRHHHEHYNGEGLPDALESEAIPLEARIVTLADVFDALLSRRAYKPAWELDDVLIYIQANKGRLFDPVLVDALTDNIEDFTRIRLRYLDEAEATQSLLS